MRHTILSQSIRAAFGGLGFSGASSLTKPFDPPGTDRPMALVPDLHPNGRTVRVRWGPNHLTDEIYDFSTWIGEDVWQRPAGWHLRLRLLGMPAAVKRLKQ